MTAARSSPRRPSRRSSPPRALPPASPPRLSGRDLAVVREIAREVRPRMRAILEHEFARGARAAAAVAEQYDAVTAHDHRLGDCILGKLNLRPGKPRKNRAAAENHAGHAWVRGFATALAEVYRLLADGNEAKGIRDVARAAGVDLAALRVSGVSAHDRRALERAGLP